MKFLRILFIVIIPLVLIITLFNIPLQNKFGIFAIWLIFTIPGLDSD